MSSVDHRRKNEWTALSYVVIVEQQWKNVWSKVNAGDGVMKELIDAFALNVRKNNFINTSSD